MCTCICITYAFVYLLYTHRATCRYKHRRAFWISYCYQQCCRRIKYCTINRTDGIKLHLETPSESFLRCLYSLHTNTTIAAMLIQVSI